MEFYGLHSTAKKDKMAPKNPAIHSVQSGETETSGATAVEKLARYGLLRGVKNRNGRFCIV